MSALRESPHRALAPPLWFRAGARARVPATLAGVLLLVAGPLGGWLLPEGSLPGALALALGFGGFALLLLGLALTLFPFAPPIAPRPVAPPVRGRWSAVNSPTSRVPSHGTHGLGQTFAVDLLYEPQDGVRPAFGQGAAFRPPRDFPAFGQPVRAPAAGRVVATHNRARDHRSRSSWAAIAFMVVEGMVRELAGSPAMLGNHVVLDLGEGVWAALAHLRQGSVAVQPGQQVEPGEVLGHCGNSGNSSEPHLHFQLMDHPRPAVAAGLPFVFTGVRGGDGTDQDGTVPANGQVMVVQEP